MTKEPIVENEKIAVLGAARGLGREIVKVLAEGSEAVDLLVASRKSHLLHELAEEVRSRFHSVRVDAFDFSKPEEQRELLASLLLFNPERVFYVAGGGPHGDFSSKKWADHQWALEVSFLFPARLLHQMVQWEGHRQLVFVGSDIAENRNNRGSASYGAAKQALRSLIGSVAEEVSEKDIRLFSPGYMDTDLLPRTAWPRKNSEILQPQSVAASFLQWVSLPKSEWHFRLPGSSC